MASAATGPRDRFAAELRAALQVASTANAKKTEDARNSTFALWTTFCQSLGVNPSLEDVYGGENKLAYILVFGLRYRQGGAQGQPVKADTVASALLAVGTGISRLGQPDPRKEVPGSKQHHPLLTSFLKSLRNKDDPAKRSYPANITIIRHLFEVLDYDHPTDGQANFHVIYLTIIAFYWLLRPSEYTKSTTATVGFTENFRFCDVTFTMRDPTDRDNADKHYVLLATDPSLNDLQESDVYAATLLFNEQKNSVKGEMVSQRANNDPNLCPAKALFRLTQHLRDHHAASTTPLCGYYDSHHQLSYVKSSFITNGLRYAAKDLQQLSGIDPFLLSARSLRPGGATALLCAGIDSDVIKLLGRWKSDAMFRYLRIQSHIYQQNISQRMLDHGSYTFAPGAFTKDADMPLPIETPQAFSQVINHMELYDD